MHFNQARRCLQVCGGYSRSVLQPYLIEVCGLREEDAYRPTCHKDLKLSEDQLVSYGKAARRVTRTLKLPAGALP
jgi:hypothetical protein